MTTTANTGRISRRQFGRMLFSGAAAGAAAGLAAPAWLAAATAAGAGAKRPSFIFILTDDHGWCDTSAPMDPNVPDSCCPYIETPNMSRLSREGMRFSNGYSPAPLCTPTRRSIQFGMTPARIHGTEFKSRDFKPKEHLALAQMLKGIDPAYRCAHFGKWGENMDALPEDLGYDESDGDTGNRTGNTLPGGGGKGGRDRFAAQVTDDPKLSFSLAQRANDFVERQTREGRPFYLQISFYAAHLDVYARQATLDKYRAKGEPPRQITPDLAAMIADLDDAIGRVLAKLDALGIADSTYVFFSADNGGRDGYPVTNDALPPRNHPLRESKHWLYEGGLRVPFVVRGPGIAAGAVCDEPVVGYDLLPTLSDLAGNPAALPAEIDGGSIRPLLENGGKGAVKRAEPFLVFHRPASKRGQSVLRQGDYKLVVFTWSPAKIELYDLRKDVGETKDLSQAMPEKTRELQSLLVNYLKAVDAETPKGVTL